MKFCKDCKFVKLDRGLVFFFNNGRFEFALCGHPRFEKEKSMDPISGKVISTGKKYCSIERSNAYLSLGVCGKDAKYFEPKVSGNGT